MPEADKSLRTASVRHSVSNAARIAFLSIVVLCTLILPLSANAAQQVSFAMLNYPGNEYAGPFSDANVNSSHGQLLESEYTFQNSYRNILSYFNGENPGINCLASMDVVGAGAQVLYAPNRFGGRWAYIVLSPDFYRSSAIENNGPVTITFNLTDQEPGWNLNAIGLEIINYDKYRETQDKPHVCQATGKILVNGHEVQAPSDALPTEIRVDLTPEENPVRQIVIEADAHASVGFRAVTLYLDDEPQFIPYDDDRAATPDFNPEGCYQLPYYKIGMIDEPTQFACAIFNSKGERMNVEAAYDSVTQYFAVTPAAENGDIMDEGYYDVVYYLKDDNGYEPVASDGVRFAVLPSPQGMFLNWLPIDVKANGEIQVPSHTTHTTPDGDLIQYDWEHVLINGFRPGTSVYYKIYGEPTPIPTAERPANEVRRRTAPTVPSSEIPDGYEKLQNNTVDLSKGNKLSLILQRNGMTSYPTEISYTRWDVPTSVVEIPVPEKGIISTEFFDMTGRRIAEESASSPGCLIKVEHLTDGTIRTTKTFICR